MANTLSKKIIIVGGGAGGLELAAKLGRRFGRETVFLIDKEHDHIWKPSLHEVAAGTLDIHREGLSYFMLARDCHFTFLPGEMLALDRDKREISLAPVVGPDHEEVFPARSVEYDYLVLCVGSQTNFFGTKGADEYAVALDSTAQAERFRLKLLNELISTHKRAQKGLDDDLCISIVGGGATGVELAAELLEASADLHFYGVNTPGHTQQRAVRITLMEGADRILSALPEKVSASAHALLVQRGVRVQTGVRVAEIGKHVIIDAEGKEYPSDLCVWAAGIKAPAFLCHVGLPVNRLNQLIVDAYLRTEDPNIWAIGDCAQAPWGDSGTYLPARAQVAHQQASYLYRRFSQELRGRPPQQHPFQFKDYGSLVSVGQSRGVGSLMGVLVGRSWFVKGVLARGMYMSLHLMHHMAVLGWVRTFTLALGRLLSKRAAPRVKLH